MAPLHLEYAESVQRQPLYVRLPDPLGDGDTFLKLLARRTVVTKLPRQRAGCVERTYADQRVSQRRGSCQCLLAPDTALQRMTLHLPKPMQPAGQPHAERGV